MPRAAHVFRVFVSSTFSDLQAERMALHERVFPRLRALCAGLGAQFQAIDLRWGVTAEASIDQRAVSICLEEVDRCRAQTTRPNFLLLLGDRYGWRPPPPAIPAVELRRLREHLSADAARLVDRWYVEDLNAVPPVCLLQPRRGDFAADATWRPVEHELVVALSSAAAAAGLQDPERNKYQASVTEQEVFRGVLADPAEPGAAHAFLRLTKALPRDATALPYTDLVDGAPDDDAARALTRLRDGIRARLGAAQVREYEATWDTGLGRPTTRHIDALCEDVYAALAAVIEAEMTTASRVDSLDQELAEHHRFGAQRSHNFVGRQQTLDALTEYIRSDRPHPLLVVGAPGVGKTALLAELVRRLHSAAPGAELAVRFVGATPRSTDLRTFVTDLLLQLRRLHGDATGPPAGLPAVVDAVREEIGGRPPQPRLILVLDALDQVAEDTLELAWLPPRLPPGVRIVLSAPPGVVAEKISNHIGTGPMTLGPMLLDEGELLLDRWLSEANRGLQPHQRAEVLAAFAVHGNPLHLRFAFEEARRWRSGAPAYPGTLAADVPGIIGQLLDRLESDHGPALVREAMGLLAASRTGLAEDEELDLLSWETELLDQLARLSPHAPAMAGRLPPVLWARLYADLEPYLNVRNVDGRVLFGFYHRQLTEVVTARYLSGDAAVQAHQRLASYFKEQPLDLTGTDATLPNLRKLTELPYQQAHSVPPGTRPAELIETLSDLDFIDMKCSAGRTYDLLADYERMPAPAVEIGEYAGFVRKHAQRLASYPGVFFSLIQHEGFPAAKDTANELVRQGRWHRPWLRTTAAWAPAAAQAVGARAAVEVTASYRFSAASAMDLAAATDQRLVFYVRRRGQVAVASLRGGQEMPLAIETSRKQILELFCSPDGRHIVSAYADGTADVFGLRYGDDGLVVGQEPVTTLEYLVPEVEAPVMWLGKSLLRYQNAAGLLITLPLGGGDRAMAGAGGKLPAGAAEGELSGYGQSAKVTVMTKRVPGGTQIVATCADGCTLDAQRQGADVACLCLCGAEQVAVVFTNRHLVVFDVSRDLAILREELLDNLPTGIAAAGNVLLWVSDVGTVHGLDLNANPPTPPKQLHDHPDFDRARRLIALPDETFGLVTSTGAFTFAVRCGPGGGEAERRHQLGPVFRTDDDRGYVGIQERPDGVWVVDADRRQEFALPPGLSPGCAFGIDGTDHLLGVGEWEGTVLVDLGSRANLPVPRLPRHITRVAGSPYGGFWLADAQGAIYYLAVDGSCHQVWASQAEVVGLPMMRSWPGLTIWVGFCRNARDAVPFIGLLRQRAAAQVPEVVRTRWYSVADGRLAALAFDPIQDQLWLVWEGGSAAGTLRIDCGTPEAFVARHEQTSQVHGVDEHVTAATAVSGGAGVFLLSGSGNLLYLDASAARVQAVLVPTIPLTALAQDGRVPARSALGVTAGTSLIACQLEGKADEQP